MTVWALRPNWLYLFVPFALVIAGAVLCSVVVKDLVGYWWRVWRLVLLYILPSVGILHARTKFTWQLFSGLQALRCSLLYAYWVIGQWMVGPVESVLVYWLV